MNIHDLTTNPYTATRGSAYIIVYLIPRTVLKIRRPCGNDSAGVPVGPVRLRITAGSRHYAGSLHIIHSDWDSIKFWLDQVSRPTPPRIRLVLPFAESRPRQRCSGYPAIFWPTSGIVVGAWIIISLDVDRIVI